MERCHSLARAGAGRSAAGDADGERDCSRTEEPAGSSRGRSPTTLCPFRALARTIVTSDDEIKEIAPDPKGAQIAWVTDSVSHRLEDPKHNEIYLVSSAGGEARRLTNNQALENGLHWSPDGSKIFFHVGAARVRSTDRTATYRDGCTCSIPQAGR